MSYRPSPKYASKDSRLGAWTTCDRCGFISNQSDMQFQYDFLGGSTPQSTGYLVCPRCLDDLRWQNMLLIIPPDPPPIYNTRPETYTVDETTWLTTEDSEIISTEDGSEFIAQIPNPDGSRVNTAKVSTEADVNITTEDGNPIIAEIPNDSLLQGTPVDIKSGVLPSDQYD